MSTKTDDVGEYMNELADQNGVAVATVADGTVLLFRRDYLLKLLAENTGNEKLIILVKHSAQN